MLLLSSGGGLIRALIRLKLRHGSIGACFMSQQGRPNIPMHPTGFSLDVIENLCNLKVASRRVIAALERQKEAA
jgi:hypothetical protein